MFDAAVTVDDCDSGLFLPSHPTLPGPEQGPKTPDY